MIDRSESSKSRKFPFGLWIAFGLLGGTAAGIFLDNLALGAGIGLILGILVGILTKSFGSKAEGRV